MRKIVIDGTAVYEIDENCLKRREKQEMEEKKNKKKNKEERDEEKGYQ